MTSTPAAVTAAMQRLYETSPDNFERLAKCLRRTEEDYGDDAEAFNIFLDEYGFEFREIGGASVDVSWRELREFARGLEIQA